MNELAEDYPKFLSSTKGKDTFKKGEKFKMLSDYVHYALENPVHPKLSVRDHVVKLIGSSVRERRVVRNRLFDSMVGCLESKHKSSGMYGNTRSITGNETSASRDSIRLVEE
ncbi:hypothetical protein RF11_15691 [Thelohanellus kitauei]|uniref:Uncharacterized protein n=1 Tax=Thelohanellus kitauei TaxID=669202 RepID=A0A0C2N0K7_THEKT|nr:hypothetical protein RF11_15691 [Thelohanellus kitauei]